MDTRFVNNSGLGKNTEVNELISKKQTTTNRGFPKMAFFMVIDVETRTVLPHAFLPRFGWLMQPI